MRMTGEVGEGQTGGRAEEEGKRGNETGGRRERR